MEIEQDFERFMRFAQRYAAANGLGYAQNQNDDDTNQTADSTRESGEMAVAAP